MSAYHRQDRLYRVLYGRILSTALWCHHHDYYSCIQIIESMDAHPPFLRPSRALRDGVRSQTQEILPSIDYLLLHQGKERCLNFLREPPVLSHVSYHYSSIWRCSLCLSLCLMPLKSSKARQNHFFRGPCIAPSWLELNRFLKASLTNFLLVANIHSHALDTITYKTHSAIQTLVLL